VSPIVIMAVLVGVLLVSGAPIFVAVGGSALAGLFAAGQPIDTAASVFISTVGNFALIAIPLFIFMAELMTTAGMIEKLIGLLNAFVGHWRGGLGYTAVLASAIFAAFSGSSAANAAALSVALVPQMKAAGYPARFAAGTVAAGGTLGILIPPSINMIIYSSVTGLPVLELFRAAVIPGLLLTGLFMIVVATTCRNVVLQPFVPWPERRRLLRDYGLLLLLPAIVLGSIYSGVLTVNESAVAGIVFAIILQVFYFRNFRWRNVYTALVRTAKTTSMIYLILGTASMFGYVLTLSQFAQNVAQQLTPLINFSVVLFYALAMIFLIMLGMFIDVAAITYIVIPVLDVTLMLNHFDRTQFAMMFIINMELGLITPPFGLNTFIASSSAKIPIGEVFRGAIPFCIAMVVCIIFVGFLPVLTR
jgi:C4-dicarboxylate transporter, DctM subunit